MNEIDETDIDDVQLLILDLAEIFVRYNISPVQALEYIEEHYPVMHVELMAEFETLH